MGYHAYNFGGNIPVYGRSSSDGPTIATLYNGESFVFVGQQQGYQGSYEIRCRDRNGNARIGYINVAARGHYGNMAFYGSHLPTSILGNCYRFELRENLKLVSTGGVYQMTLTAGSYVYTNDAIAGASNPYNMYIIGYRRGETGNIVSYKGFVTLNYNSGSYLSVNFCLKA